MNMSGRRVLLIDDDTALVSIFQTRLSRRGFSVECASDASGLIDRVLGFKPEIVLMDIFMPQISGLEALTEIRGRWSREELPVIMTTALDDTSGIVEAFGRGANDYITKPISVDVAAARIQAHLSVSDLFRSRMSLETLKKIQALVVTYNHEINNPLQVAMAALDILTKSGGVEESLLQRLDMSLQRIAEVTRRIRDATSNEANLELIDYTSDVQQIKLKK